MNNKKDITQVIERENVNEHGEITVETEIVTKYTEKEPDYIKMYISDIARLRDIPKGMDVVLMALIKNMGYNNVIATYMPVKKFIASDLNISIDYVNKCITRFHKQGVLIRIDRGLYVADPNLFARGSWTDIKQLRLVIEYNNDGTKQIKSNVPEEMQLKLGFSKNQLDNEI